MMGRSRPSVLRSGGAGRYLRFGEGPGRGGSVRRPLQPLPPRLPRRKGSGPRGIVGRWETLLPGQARRWGLCLCRGQSLGVY